MHFRTTFSLLFPLSHTTLEYEETPELAEGLKKLEDGFPKTIAIDLFYDPDFLIEARLSRGPDNFPGVELVTFLKLKEGKVVAPYQVRYLEVIPGNHLLNEMLGSRAFSIIDSYPNCGFLGIFGTPPSSLFDRFSYHRIKTMEVAYALSLRLNASSRHDEEVARLKAALVSVEKERDEAIFSIDELDALCSKHHSECESKSQDVVRGFTNKCYDMEVQISDLQRALDDSIEGFMWREEYHTLLKRDTTTLLRSFSQRVAKDYLGISSHFTNFVTYLGEGYVVSLFDELPTEEPAESDDESESHTSKEEPSDKS
ncbi:hypothetical protein LIER_22437 [Lithospermum erythrorhizon]|uniref:Uncharacterized protein n=1 Tax=Lithospermum erythrorhizon TaxID=34254 RepID=A0AAV3QU32_LITER